MTQDEITRMAREAGFVGFDGKNKTLAKFAALVAAHEREECIKLVHAGTSEPVQTKTLFILQKERKRIEDAIRARGTA